MTPMTRNETLRLEPGEALDAAAAKVGASFDLSSLDGNNGFVIEGGAKGDQSGVAVSAAGDINKDGFADILIGAPFADPGGLADAGNAYVIYGSASGFGPSLDLGALDGSDGFVLEGVAEIDRTGFSVASAGDVNGDGIDDLLIGARFVDVNGNTYAGRSYVVFGKTQNFGASFDLANLDGSDGFALDGAAEYDHAGRAVASAGDINGDGIDDLVIGAYLADGGGAKNAGKAYVVFGKDSGFSANLSLDTLQGGGGKDSLTGGGGADTFILEIGGGDDLVTDFLSLTDVLDVSEFGFANGAAVLAATTDVNGSAVITLSAGEIVTLEGALKAELDQADFIF
jgi:hypothetical protein